jgi:hypothetical protein
MSGRKPKCFFCENVIKSTTVLTNDQKITAKELCGSALLHKSCYLNLYDNHIAEIQAEIAMKRFIDTVDPKVLKYLEKTTAFVNINESLV